MEPGTSGPSVSVVIPTRDRISQLRRCLASVYQTDGQEPEVIVVDDASSTDARTALSGEFPRAQFLRNPVRRLLSFSRNAGAEAARGNYIFFLDDDNIVAPDTIPTLAGALDKSESTAVATPVIYFLSRPEVVWTSYITKSRYPGFYPLHTDVPPQEFPTFSFHNSFMVKRKIFFELGEFDSKDLPIRFGEVDFAHRVSQAGYRAVLCPTAKAWHDIGWKHTNIDSARAYYTERNRIVIVKRYESREKYVFYAACLLPFVTVYYLVQHPLSTSDGRVKTASALVKGIASGLTFKVK